MPFFRDKGWIQEPMALRAHRRLPFYAVNKEKVEKERDSICCQGRNKCVSEQLSMCAHLRRRRPVTMQHKPQDARNASCPYCIIDVIGSIHSIVSILSLNVYL